MLAKPCLIAGHLGAFHTFADSLEGADLAPVLHGVQCEVNFWDRLLLAQCADGIVNLGSVRARQRSGDGLSIVHGDRSLYRSPEVGGEEMAVGVVCHGMKRICVSCESCVFVRSCFEV